MKCGNSCHSSKVHTCGGTETRQLLETKQAGIRKDTRQGMLNFHMKKLWKTGNKMEMNRTCSSELSTKNKSVCVWGKCSPHQNIDCAIKHPTSFSPTASYTLYNLRKSLSYTTMSPLSLHFQFSSFPISSPPQCACDFHLFF